jgi:hypothetical protein
LLSKILIHERRRHPYHRRRCLGRSDVRAAYGTNYGRLVEIKKKYDPNNVLRLNQNIKPS